ncbi:hypothetical protein BDF14DRAFT_1761684 [Spinellus fusiger]|nr:hypothetical protein BDF14DRAFT_1761684 [Spinellus fusiger]
MSSSVFRYKYRSTICSHCGKGYSNLSNLAKHKLAKHKAVKDTRVISNYSNDQKNRIISRSSITVFRVKKEEKKRSCPTASLGELNNELGVYTMPRDSKAEIRKIAKEEGAVIINLTTNDFNRPAMRNNCFPDKPKSHWIIHRFFSENNEHFSKHQAGKVLELLKDVKEAWLEEPTTDIPALDSIFNFHQ